MHSSYLQPPNVHMLSDGVIGKVRSSTTTRYTSSRPQYFQHPHDDVAVDTHGPLQAPLPVRAAAPSKHKGMLNPVPNKSPSELAVNMDVPDQYAAKLLTAEGKGDTELRRQRSRTGMQRYRKKIEDHAIALERDVRKLRGETQTLQVQCQTLSSGVPTGTTALSVVAEYFRLFRYGLKGSALLNDPDNSTKVAPNTNVSSVQRDFLHAATSPDVVGETGFGVESLIEDYRRLALYLPDSDTQLVRLDTGPEDSLTATTTVGITITANTLRFAFPHLVHNGDRDQWSPLAAKLLDQRFVLRGLIHFKWDSITSRVKLVQSKADLLTPMLHLLGDLETVSRVFDNALVTPECKLAQ